MSCRRLCLRHARLQLQQPGARDVGQSEIGIGRKSTVEPRLAAGPRRQKQVDRGNVILYRGGTDTGDRQIKAVLQQHDASPNRERG
jgi:hypothetical protein